MECLHPELIEQYVQNKIQKNDRLAIDEHLKICQQCRQAMDNATENESLLNELQTHGFPTISMTRDKSLAPEPAMTVDQAQAILQDQYSVVKKVGQGASGEVFLAMDPALDRAVAVKFLRQKPHLKIWEKDQWREGKFMSRVNHPNVAHIYHIGEYDGKCYIVMEWVDGIPLTQAWEKESLSKRLKLYMQVLEAIESAHQKGIVHRDIKPSNILVTAAGEVKVLDFGIALAVDHSLSGEMNVYRGTPAYSAPEQITSPDTICPATDVFVLGILLYQLLTDSLPFTQSDSQELFDAICHQHPELPSAIQETVPLPLQNICLKALEKDINSRYSDAHAFANDILRYLRGEKVWSRPSFVNDQIQQDVFYHRQRLDVWHHNGLITEKEHDKLETIYERLLSPSDLSIIEARRLSFSQVCLYFGGWVVVLGCAVLLSSSWANIAQFFRPVPAFLCVLMVLICGRYLWKINETRLSVGFLATGCLLLPVAILLTLGHYHLFSPEAESYSLGTETVANFFDGFPPSAEDDRSAIFFIGNLQLLIATSIWLMASMFFLRTIRSSIFVIFCILSFLGLLSTCYVISGMEHWRLDIIAGRYLFAGIVFFALGMVLDRRKLTKYAWPLSGIGLVLIVGCLSYIAISDATLFGWLYPNSQGYPEWYENSLLKVFENDDEMRAMGFFCNGLIYFGLARLCRRQGTRLQRTLGQIFNWLGPLHVLGALRASDEFVSGDVRQFIYRTALPVASLAFIFGSVSRQMKSFVFSGLSGIAVSVQKFTTEYFEDIFFWPIILILLGILFMLLSWWLPHLKARKTLQRE
jgi:serine/threonine protein kinase